MRQARQRKTVQDRSRLHREMLAAFGVDRFPKRVPLNTRILYKRTFLEHEEWKIEYDVESADTMPVEAGRSVPAYLLIPRCQQTKPLPAVICFHQCAIHCVLGKEAVVGKVPRSSESGAKLSQLRPHDRVSCDLLDQTYGFDLVHQGFVVLSPDSINCGERNIEAIRKKGENRACFEFIDKQLGRSFEEKHLLDDMRAVDLLESLGFVDSERIGAVGHSLGAGDVYRLMVADERVKAGIASGLGTDAARFIALTSPRLLVGVRGEFDGTPEVFQSVSDMYANALQYYETDGAPENLVFLSGEFGHRFLDEHKWKAYKLLKQYLGLQPEREIVQLEEIVEDARKATQWWWEEDQHAQFSVPKVSGDTYVFVSREEITSAITGLFLYLSTAGSKVRLQIIVRGERGCGTLECRIPSVGDEGRCKESGSSYETLREVERILAEHDTSLRREHRNNELVYSVSFPSAG